MGQRFIEYLHANKLTLTKQLPWQADLLTINNPTNQPVYIRLGAQDTPTAKNYDDVIPPFMYRQIRIHTAWLALALGGVPTIGASLLPDTAVKVMVKYSVGDPPESATTYPLQSITGASTVVSGGVSGTVGPFDLLTWGGLILRGHTNSNNWNQQGYATYQVSPDLVNWADVVRLPLWPGMVLVAELPRIDRYARVLYQPYGAPWDAAAQFLIVARPSITEILSVTPSLAGSAPQWAWGPLGANTTFYFPGDLVAAIDWAIDNRSLDTVTINASGGLAATGVPREPLVASRGLSGNTMVHGTWGEPLAAIALNVLYGGGAPSGIFSAVPLIRAGPPDVIGQPSDTVVSNTIPGLLKVANADLDNLSGQVPGLLTSILGEEVLIAGRIFNKTIFAGGPTLAGAWNPTGTLITPNEWIRGFNLSVTVGQADMRLAFGTPGAVNIASAFWADGGGATHSGPVMFPTGCEIQVTTAGNNTLWLFTAAVTNFSGVIYTTTS